MILLRRRRPLMRGAIIGGTAYAVGKSHARNEAQDEAQNEQINELQNSQSQPPQQQAVPQGDDLTGKLEKLTDMKNSGALSDSEFQAAKQKLLNT